MKSHKWTDSNASDRKPQESWYSTLINTMMIIVLLPNTNSLFTFPLVMLNHGGYFFFIIYFVFSCLICFPMLHLELYVAHFTRSGIIKAMRMHGIAYTGLGVAIIMLTMMNQHELLHNGYFLLKNLWNVIDDPTQIVDCRSAYVVDYRPCVSAYNDKQCMESGLGAFFVKGKCTNSTANGTDFIEMAAIVYSKTLIKRSQEHIDFEVLLLQYFLMFVCASFGRRYLRALLASFFPVVFCFHAFLIHDIPFYDLNKLHLIMVTFSNPAALFKIETYLMALRTAISSYGLCTLGLFSAASFQKQHSRTYTTTMLIFVWVMLSNIVSTLIELMMMYEINYDASLSSIRTSIKGIRHALSAVPEHIYNHGQHQQALLVVYYLITFLMNLSSCFGMIFVVYAFIRDYLPNLGWFNKKLTCYAYCHFSFAYYLTFTTTFADEENTLESSIISCSKYILMCMMVIVFVYAYGVKEFEIDVTSVLGQWSGWLSFLNISEFFTAHQYLLITLAVFQIIECNRLVRWLQFRSLYDRDQLSTPIDSQGFLLSMWYLLPYFIPLVYLFWISKVEKVEFSTLFDVTPDHPSYKRREEEAVDAMICQLSTEEIVR